MSAFESMLPALREHAADEYPRECCGLVVVAAGVMRYLRCRNIATSAAEFAIDPVDYAAAEDLGEIVAIAHSHPNLPPLPSEADRVQCEATGLPWIIVNHPVGTVFEFAPDGYQAPLVGRRFHLGVLDCFELVRDYYQRTLAITLPSRSIADEWWFKGRNHLVDQYAANGFVRVDARDLQPHDVLLMQIGAPVSNHCALYLSDNHILHHLFGRLSSRDVYGGFYRKVTTCVLRHQSQQEAACAP